jgi:UDP-N-acetylmuramate dehydrogenase
LARIEKILISVSLLFPLSTYHTFGLNSQCQAFLALNELSDVITNVRDQTFDRFCLLGEGSNTIFVEDYDGMVLKVQSKGIKVVEHDSHYLITVAAGENWHDLVVWCLSQNIYGFENLALIPGTVGAAPIQNIGAYGVELEQFIEYVEYIDLSNGEKCRLNKHQCQFGYRDSIFKRQLADCCVISHVTFNISKRWQPVTHYGELSSLPSPSAQDIFDCVVQVRRNKLPNPSEIGNAGSFFKNPVVSTDLYLRLQNTWSTIPSYRLDAESVKIPAAWLIDRLGFKGKTLGGIACHPTQALVLTNDGSGTGEQLLQMATNIRDTVLREFEIELINEVRLMGRSGLVSL